MRLVLTLLGAVMFSTSALAVSGYSETKSGDLSNDGLAPTPIKTKVGPNIIDGNDGVANGVIDRDYFVIRIAPGQQLASIVLASQTRVGGSVSFLGVEVGKQVTVDPNGFSAAGLLGWTHYATSQEGSDLLPKICKGGNGATGCKPPLGPGIYSFWAQETSTCNCHYRFTFNITSTAAGDEAKPEEQ